MIVVDASALFEVVVDGPDAEMLRAALLSDTDHVAPHAIDIEVFSLIRRDLIRNTIDASTAELAMTDLRGWPGERYSHRPLLQRAWELRDNVRSWDAMYVALAEVLGVPLLTRDRRLAGATGPKCEFLIV